MTSRNPASERASGLGRISTLTRWTVAGAVAGTGMFAALAAHATSSTPAKQNAATTPTTVTIAPSTDDNSTDDGASQSTATQNTTQLQPTIVQSGSGNASPTVVSGAS